MKCPPLYIRADASPAIGTGHVMRCLALAQEWQRLGGAVFFIGRLDAPSLVERMTAEGFRWLPLSAGATAGSDEVAAVARHLAAGGEPSPWLVLDGYHFDSAYQRQLRQGRRLLVIDDDALLPEYDCDLVLNQNMHASDLSYPAAPGTTVLRGPRYALLRREFRHGGVRENHPDVARKILVTLGGADPHNVTALVLDALARLEIAGLEVVVVAGPANPHRQRLLEAAAALPFRCEVRQAAAEMAALMQWAEVAITAAGTTTYELAALGVPFLAMVIADNQRRNGAGLAGEGVTRIVGEMDGIDPVRLAAELAAFLTDGALRQARAGTGRRLVDGGGASRVVAAILARDVRLRPVCPADEALLLRWANDPETRANSFCNETITPAGHAQWLAAKLAAPDCALYLATDSDHTPLGVARFDMVAGRAVLSVGIGPEFRRQGLGSSVIRAACERIFAEHPLAAVEALVKAENHASLRAFDKAGFAVAGRSERNGMAAVALHCRREACHG